MGRSRDGRPFSSRSGDFPPLPPFPCSFPAVGPTPRPKLAVLSVSRCPLCTPYGHLQIHPQLGHHWASRDETEVTRAYSSSSFLFPRGRGKGLWHSGQKGNVRADIFFPFFLRSRKREPSHLDAKGGRNWGEALPSFFSSFRPLREFPYTFLILQCISFIFPDRKGGKKGRKRQFQCFP